VRMEGSPVGNLEAIGGKPAGEDAEPAGGVAPVAR